MNVLIIARNYKENSGQGVDRVTYNLIKELKKYCNVGIISHNVSGTIKSVFYDFLLIFKLINKKADVYHAMVPYVGFPLVLLNKKNSIVTIHDLIPFFYKEMHPLSRIYYWFCVKLCKKADKIITVSNYSKKEIINFLNVNKEKINVVYNGVDFNRFFPKKREENKIFKVGFIGGLTKQKNAFGLVKAFSKIKLNCIELIIAGKGKEYNKIKEFIKSNNIKNIKLIGFIDDKDLSDFYRSLDLFVYPSFYEGFGLPVIEAMACGVPVIASDRSSLPEIIGDIGILINPHKEEEIVKSIEKIIKDKKLRKKMAKEGIKRAKLFNWEKTAKETLKVYKKCLK